jgi:aminoglycoside 2'-N-acetyltransferase I
MPLRQIATAELRAAEVQALRTLFAAAWPDGAFDETDWDHATGGVHVVAEDAGRIVAHASVVARSLEIGTRALRAGYVEAVATLPELAGRGHGSAVMGEANEVIRARYELGALSTGVHRFYERLGWLRWRGPTFVRTDEETRRTEEDDDGVMVLPTPSSPDFDLDAAIVCDWRPGDVW